MKNILNYLLLGSLISMTMFACKKNNDPSPVSKPASNNSITAIIDGRSFMSDKTTGDVEDDDNIRIVGYTGKQILYLVTPFKIGTATVDIHFPRGSSGGVYYADSTYKDGAHTKVSTSGQVTITSINETNKMVSGTFNLITIDSLGTGKIENGKFTNVSYTVARSIYNGTTSCKVDGTLFNGKYVLAKLDTLNGVENIVISGFENTDHNSQYINLKIPSDATINQHDIISSSDNYGFTYSESQHDYFYCTTGSITITAKDAAKRTISGTFSGTVTFWPGVTKNITEGSFTSTY